MILGYVSPWFFPDILGDYPVVVFGYKDEGFFWREGLHNVELKQDEILQWLTWQHLAVVLEEPLEYDAQHNYTLGELYPLRASKKDVWDHFKQLISEDVR